MALPLANFPPSPSLTAVSVATIGTTMDCSVCHQTASMAVTLAFTAAPTTISTVLQGSLDNVNWYQLAAPITSVAAGTIAANSTGTPFRYVRANCTTLTGGTAVTVSAMIGVAN